MWSPRVILFVSLILCGIAIFCEAWDGLSHHVAHRIRIHKAARRHRAVATNDGTLRFEPAPYSRKLEHNSSGKIHCKVAGGVAPNVQWFWNSTSPLPDGVTSTNGTLHVAAASPRIAGIYTCRATDGDKSIQANITIDVVVAPKILEPLANQTVEVAENSDVMLHCMAVGEPEPTTHWDRNLVILSPQQEGVEVEGGPNEDTASTVLYKNGSLLLRKVSNSTSRVGCTAGSAAGLARHDVYLLIHPEGWSPPLEPAGVGSKAVIVCVSVAAAYMSLVLALMVYCRRRRLARRERGEKLELELVEGREKLVEEGEEKPQNGVATNGRLLHDNKESGPDNSESCTSKASKKSGQFNHLSLNKNLLTDMISIGRGEFGEVSLAKLDLNQVKKLRNKEHNDTGPDLRSVLVKALTSKQEWQLCEFRRQLELFSRVRHENLSRLFGLVNDAEPHCLVIEHTDWGELKQFLIATRTESEQQQYMSVVGQTVPHAGEAAGRSPPLLPGHAVLLASQLAKACLAVAKARLTHRDIAARNCVISSKLHLKLSIPAMTRAPYAHEYYKMHEQVIPLRWLPAEAALEGDYSAKSDVYMFASTVLEIYTKAELPFPKLNDNSVLERLKSGTLEWNVPDSVPQALADVLRKCWSKSPSDRPNFEEICEVTTALVKQAAAENTNNKSNEHIHTIAEE